MDKSFFGQYENLEALEVLQLQEKPIAGSRIQVLTLFCEDVYNNFCKEGKHKFGKGEQDMRSESNTQIIGKAMQNMSMCSTMMCGAFTCDVIMREMMYKDMMYCPMRPEN